LGRRGICYGMLKGGEGSFGATGVFSKVADFFFGGGDGCAVFFAAGAAFWRGWLVLWFMLRDISVLGA
jgi:hypothetical protein